MIHFDFHYYYFHLFPHYFDLILEYYYPALQYPFALQYYFHFHFLFDYHLEIEYFYRYYCFYFLLVGRNDIFRFEIMVQVDTQRFFLKVAYMADAGLDDKLFLVQEVPDGFGFFGRLDDNKIPLHIFTFLNSFCKENHIRANFQNLIVNFVFQPFLR